MLLSFERITRIAYLATPKFMKMQDTLFDILNKKRDSRIIPFLQSLSQAERKSLAPQLKKLIREYTTYEYDEKKGSSSIKGSYEQHRILSIAAFVCFNLKGMINTSALHNRELQVLIEALLLELDNHTVSNLKKLLEIYNELLILNKTQPATEVATLLNTRAGEGSLKKIIKQILLLQS